MKNTKVVLFAVLFFVSFGALSAMVGCHSENEPRDSVPPSTPTNLTYSVVQGSDQMVFSWDASIDEGSGIDGYLFRTSWQGVFSEHFVYVSDNSFETHIPQYDGPHTFEVKALDKEGNESGVAVLEFAWEVPT
jgi:hypothetical protein